MSALPRAHFNTLNKEAKARKIRLQADEITIADLHILVKQFDENFNPTVSSKVEKKDRVHAIRILDSNGDQFVFDVQKKTKRSTNEVGSKITESYLPSISSSKSIITQSSTNNNTPAVKKSIDDTIKDNDLRFAVDDEITDGIFDFGEDLFEDEHKEFLDEFVKTRQMLSVDNSHIYPIRQDVAIKYP